MKERHKFPSNFLERFAFTITVLELEEKGHDASIVTILADL